MTAAEERVQRTYVVAGWLVCVALAVADLVEPELVLIPLFVLAPLVTSTRATPLRTFGVAVVAAMFAVGVGWVDDIWGTRRHTVAIATTGLGGLLAVWLAFSRQARDRRLAASVPVLRAADRLKASLATGRMGEWSWDARAGTVTWDANVAELFGVEAEEFDGTFDSWIAMIDERDRAQVLGTVNEAVTRRETFRFDHRCTWPDGTVHWIEGIGDPIVDEATGEVAGAFGLAIDVDERHRQVEERTRLVEFERQQRKRVEYLASINDVLAFSDDANKIMKTVTTTVIPELAEWCSIVLVTDRPRSQPSIVVAHRDPEKVRWAEQIQRDYPYDPDARWGAAGVISSGTRELVNSIDPGLLAQSDDVLAKAGLGSVVTLPLIGALGTLGAMQLIRGANDPAFDSDDLEFVDEVAARVGAALNTAILFERERTVALTLQNRLLSTLPVTPDWIEVAASYVPATGLRIGGDWFQIIEASDGRMVAIVGDAVGHGIGSAAAMGQLRASFVTAVANDPDPVHALHAVDRFAELGADTIAASAAYILFDPNGTARYASAGHPPIVVVQAGESARIVEGARGSVLGLRGTPEESATIAFSPGDLAVMFTDGLVESRTDPIDHGLQRLVAAVDASRHLTPQQMCEAIVASLTAERVVEDDIAILILRRSLA